MLKRMVITAIKGYQAWISPFFPASCRFYPSCSEYSIAAIRNYGLVKGLIKAGLRILKCNPLHPGGYDPA